MSQRLIKIFLPEHLREAVLGHVCEQPGAEHWVEQLSEGTVLVRVLLSAESSGALLDTLESRLGSARGFRMVVLPVEASLPRPREEASPPAESAEPAPPRSLGLSREELYADVHDDARPSRYFLVMVTLSAIVAGVGILRGNVAVIVGAMVIAPLLGSNVALALATTLGDLQLGRSALLTLAAGTVITLAIGAAWGLVLPVDPAAPEVLSRTWVGPGDLALALCAGCAGVLSLTRGTSAALVGVMVAVSLLPPLVVSGLLLGSWHPRQALGALELFLCNVICVNLAGVVTFLWRGVRPLSWWEAGRARRATRTALCIWGALLVLLLCLVVSAARS